MPTFYYKKRWISPSICMMRSVSAEPDPNRHAIIGVLLKFVSVSCLALMAACVKYLGEDVPPGQIVFFRGALSILAIAAYAGYRREPGLLIARNWRAHAWRSLAGASSMFCWFIALTLIPLAQMTAISFTIPLFLTVLAMVFLHERIAWPRWLALAVGFTGVLVIVGPDLLEGHGSALGATIALLAAVSAAFALMFLRRMSGQEHALTITFYFFITSSVLAVLSLLFEPWPLPTGTQWLLLGLTGCFGLLGQITLSYCYRYAEASLVAPVDYTSLLIAVAIGFYVFGELPHLSTWIGAPLVIAAGGIIVWREYLALRRTRSAAPLPN